MFTTRMVQLIAVVLASESEKVTRELLNQGVLDFISIKKLVRGTEEGVEEMAPRVSLARIQELRNKIESLLAGSGTPPYSRETLSMDSFESVDLDGMEKHLDDISEHVQSLRNRQKELQQEVLKLEDIQRQMSMYQNIGEGLNARSTYSFLNIQSGVFPEKDREAFLLSIQAFPSVHLETGPESNRYHILITLKRDAERVKAVLNSVSWKDVELPKEPEGTKEEVSKNIDAQLSGYRAKQESINGEITSFLLDKRDDLADRWRTCVLNSLYYKIQSQFGKTAKTVLFAGWLPAGSEKELERGIMKASGGMCYLEWHNPEELKKENGDLEIPVQMNSPAILQPFQALVENYAVPEYGTVNPTPFVAVAYLIMFGLMFGDVGHGAVIFLAGIIGNIIRKKKGKGTTLFRLMIWCGISAITAGILFGSYFGMEWFKPVWFDYHGIIAGHTGEGAIQTIYDILKITVFFGIAVIGLGLVLNWINCLHRKKWFHLFFDKSGLLGGWIYGSGVYMAFYFAARQYKELPPAGFLLPMIALPAVLLFLKAPIEFALKRKKNPEIRFTSFTVMDFIMEWIVGILEIFSGYLANTLSFMRVAGLGIAHVSLMIAFFSIARMVSPGGGFSIASLLILILGNTLVIVLEGLSAGIQSLRLNYYEFFSKYFSGTGKAYSPISLKKAT